MRPSQHLPDTQIHALAINCLKLIGDRHAFPIFIFLQISVQKVQAILFRANNLKCQQSLSHYHCISIRIIRRSLPDDPNQGLLPLKICQTPAQKGIILSGTVSP